MKTKIMFCSIVLLLSVFTGIVFGGSESYWNVLYGQSAGSSITGAVENVFVGGGAGQFDTTGSSNTFIGCQAGFWNTTMSDNTFIGSFAGLYNNAAGSNTFVGSNAGLSNTGGSNNTFVGKGAGYSNTTANGNAFFGISAGYYNTTGYDNTFLGPAAGLNNTGGSSNTFLGSSAGYSNLIGGGNTFLGENSGYFNTAGNYNTFVGLGAGANSIGSGNVFVGNAAGFFETGSNKLHIGNTAVNLPLIYGEFDNNILTINGNLGVVGPDNGLVRLSNVTTDNTTKVSRMVLRHYSNAQLPVYLFGAASTLTDNFVAFGGGNTIANAATQIDLFTAEDTTTPVGTPRLTIIGNGYVGIGTQDPLYPLEMDSGAHVTTGGVWTNASSREYKDNIEALATEEALDTLKELNPVKFAYKRDRTEKHVGFIAEEVPELVSTNDRKGLSPMDIVAVLAKVVQEQQKIIQEQQKTIAVHSEKMVELERALKAKEE